VPLVNKNKKSCGTITFTLERTGQPSVLALPRPLGPKVEENAHRLDATTTQLQTIGAAISGAGEAVDNIVDMYDTWELLAEKIKVVVAVASTISEVMPLVIGRRFYH
jgi:hypothetical protein